MHVGNKSIVRNGREIKFHSDCAGRQKIIVQNGRRSLSRTVEKQYLHRTAEKDELCSTGGRTLIYCETETRINCSVNRKCKSQWTKRSGDDKRHAERKINSRRRKEGRNAGAERRRKKKKCVAR